MERFEYLIVGGGMTAAAAVDGIRSVDPLGSIGIVGVESNEPYNRPPLSKGLWKGEAVETIWRKTAHQNLKYILGRSVQSLDLRNKHAIDSERKYYSWNKLLLATGGSPRHLPFEDDRIIYFRTIADYWRLRHDGTPGARCC